MVLDTKPFFNLIRIHHSLGKAARLPDLAGRLTAMADPNNDSMKVTDLTRRCLRLFLERRVQRSITKQDVA